MAFRGRFGESSSTPRSGGSRGVVYVLLREQCIAQQAWQSMHAAMVATCSAVHDSVRLSGIERPWNVTVLAVAD
ncbi:hypothetical protein IP86_19065 [Rhodopseudomonas sp. AAP120]|nr:hypothetical protein IP86_19065 [Rhodopseudomonas sp. AAP120]